MPTNKTATAFTKPVDPLVGDAIEAWEQVRPAHPKFTDPKTGELVDLRVLLPRLAAELELPQPSAGPAAVPQGRGPARGRPRRDHRAPRPGDDRHPALQRQGPDDACSSCRRGSGTHRRSSTQHYARITPVTLTKAYTDAGYFARNVRTIEVLLDRDAITNGQAGGGGPFEFYDLGHGYCSYSFFEQCPHRMACARCDFYIPKPSSEAQLLEAKDGLQRMLVQIPLTDEERAAVEDDHDAVDRLLDRLTDTPNTGGPHTT